MPGLAVAVAVAQMYLSDSKLCYLTNKIKANVGCVCASVYRCLCVWCVSFYLTFSSSARRNAAAAAAAGRLQTRSTTADGQTESEAGNPSSRRARKARQREQKREGERRSRRPIDPSSNNNKRS